MGKETWEKRRLDETGGQTDRHFPEDVGSFFFLLGAHCSLSSTWCHAFPESGTAVSFDVYVKCR